MKLNNQNLCLHIHTDRPHTDSLLNVYHLLLNSYKSKCVHAYLSSNCKPSEPYLLSNLVPYFPHYNIKKILNVQNKTEKSLS